MFAITAAAAAFA